MSRTCFIPKARQQRNEKPVAQSGFASSRHLLIGVHRRGKQIRTDLRPSFAFVIRDPQIFIRLHAGCLSDAKAIVEERLPNCVVKILGSLCTESVHNVC